MSDIVIRRVEQGDLPALLDIYNFYVLNTPITFDIEPRTLAQRQVWLDQFAAAGRHQCLVAALRGRPVSWACSAPFNEKEAYATSVETSVYCAPGYAGRGSGVASMACCSRRLRPRTSIVPMAASRSPTRRRSACTRRWVSGQLGRSIRSAANSAGSGT